MLKRGDLSYKDCHVQLHSVLQMDSVTKNGCTCLISYLAIVIRITFYILTSIYEKMYLANK